MSILWTETDLIQATNGHFENNCQVNGTGVSIDTRTIQDGDVFIAIIGENSDGHAYVKRALEAGAACAIISNPISNLPKNAPLLFVKDTLEALTSMGHFARNRFSGKVVAITGSVGKTTTKEMLKTTLSAYGNVHAAIGSYNNHLGVPLTLSRLSTKADFCICEIGMNHIGEIAPLAKLVKPHIALITEVSSSHLGHMKNLDNIAQEKGQIITALPREGIALIPETIYGLLQFRKISEEYHVHLKTVGQSSSADIQISDIILSATQSQFRVQLHDHRYQFTLSSPGEHLVRNAGLVVGVIDSLGLNIDTSVPALKQFHTDTGRGKIIPLQGINGFVLDESYNASTLSIRTALHTLSLLASDRKIAVLGDIKELGEFSEHEHLSLLPDLVANVDLVFCCGEMMEKLFLELPPPMQGYWCETAKELIPFIQQFLQENDTLLVKGSNSMHMNVIVSALTIPSIRKN